MGAALLVALGGVAVARRQGDSPLRVTRAIGLAVLTTAGAGMVAVDDATAHAFAVDSADNAVALLDMRSGALLRTIAVGKGPNSVVVDARHHRAFVVNSTDGTVSVLDTARGNVLRTVPAGSGPVAMVADPLAARVFVVCTGSRGGDGDEGVVATLDARDGRLLRTAEAGLTPSAIALDPRHGRAFVAAAIPNTNGLGELHMLDEASGRVLRSTRVGQDPAPVITPDALAIAARLGRAYVINGGSNSVGVIDTRTGAVVGSAIVGSSPVALAVDEQTRRVFVTNAGSATISVLDARSGALLRTTPIGQNPVATAVDVAVGRVFALDGDGLTVLDARSGATLRRVAVGRHPSALDIDDTPRPGTPAGRVLVTATGDADAAGLLLGPSTLSVLDARTGAVTRAIPIGVGPAAVAVDARTGTAVTLNTGGTLRVRDGLAWIPSGVRRLAPMLPRPARTTTLPVSVSIVDPSR